MARKKTPGARTPNRCFDCRHWAGRPKVYEEIGETRGTCMWLVNFAVTHASIGIPLWVADQPPVRVTYDDDGVDCEAWTQGDRP